MARGGLDGPAVAECQAYDVVARGRLHMADRLNGRGDPLSRGVLCPDQHAGMELRHRNWSGRGVDAVGRRQAYGAPAGFRPGRRIVCRDGDRADLVDGALDLMGGAPVDGVIEGEMLSLRIEAKCLQPLQFIEDVAFVVGGQIVGMELFMRDDRVKGRWITAP